MTEIAPATDIYLLPSLNAAFKVAAELGARGVGLDLEGVVGNYVGNTPYSASFDDFKRDQGEVNMGHTLALIRKNPHVHHGIITNNTNRPIEGKGAGLVTQVADQLDVPFVHKGMSVGGAALRAKPSGELSRHFCEITGIAPKDTVLIDDQGVKNAGEAVRAGLKAILVPPPIGLLDNHGRVVEHPWVQRGRTFEPSIYKSLETRGRLARVAYGRIAGIDINSIGQVYDHRDS